MEGDKKILFCFRAPSFLMFFMILFVVFKIGCNNHAQITTDLKIKIRRNEKPPAGERKVEEIFSRNIFQRLPSCGY